LSLHDSSGRHRTGSAARWIRSGWRARRRL